jgi:hypothetical protein
MENDLVRQNPMVKVVEEYVQKRHDYLNQVHDTFHTGFCNELLDNSESEEVVKMDKPRLAEFLQCFEEKIREVNITYKMCKAQFEQDMKSFRECDIREEEEVIEK